MSEELAERIAADLETQLVERIKAKQVELTKPDTEFAPLLGISSELWRKVRTRRLPLGQTIVVSVLARWQDLYGPAMAYMIQRGISVSGNGNPPAACGNPIPDNGHSIPVGAREGVAGG